MEYGKLYSTKKTNQTEVIPGRKDQVKNNSGGYVFKIDDMMRVRRFLILGSSENTFYQTSKKLTVQNAKLIQKLIQSGKGMEVINMTIQVSSEGLTRKNEPAIFVMAVAMTFGDEEVKRYTIQNFTKIVRIGTHLFQFIHTLKQLRGMGKLVKEILAEWYMKKPVSNLAFQVAKYQGRTIEEGKSETKWTHRDVLRLMRFKPDSLERDELFCYCVKGEGKTPFSIDNYNDLKIISGLEKAKVTKDQKEIINLIIDYNLTREMIPTEFLNQKEVQEVLFEKMGMTALIRSLAQFTKSGLITDYNTKFLNKLSDKLTNEELIQKARIHPLQVADAIITYNNGQSFRGTSQWAPNTKVLEMLGDAFYKSFKFVEPTGKKIMIGLDISGSMTSQMNNTLMSCRQASAVMAMVTMRSERDYIIKGFASGNDRSNMYYNQSTLLIELGLKPSDDLAVVMRKISNIPFGATDCALPMIDAKKQGCKDIDAFVIYTDNETYAGNIQPCQALKEYRNFSGNPDVKLIVVGMTSTGFSISDPSDPNMFDMVGASSDTPKIISDIISGKI